MATPPSCAGRFRRTPSWRSSPPGRAAPGKKLLVVGPSGESDPYHREVRGAACGGGAVSRRHLRSGAAGRTASPRRPLPARPRCRRHQPVVGGGDGRGQRGHCARQRLQPLGGRAGQRLLPRSTRPRGDPLGRAVGPGAAPRHGPGQSCAVPGGVHLGPSAPSTTGSWGAASRRARRSRQSRCDDGGDAPPSRLRRATPRGPWARTTTGDRPWRQPAGRSGRRTAPWRTCSGRMLRLARRVPVCPPGRG